ncbi:hypothetical protein GW17_00019236 [Ensete ventricosum]|nr:hypothetical protein GW17_00019236 [Ensete ventricosum]RZR97028.1 hypothetical protein BHM03_00026133 [Ensete ventricosum]
MAGSYGRRAVAAVWGEGVARHTALMAHGGAWSCRTRSPPPRMLDQLSTWSLGLTWLPPRCYCSEFRAWEELIPDALGLIFSNLSLQEILTVVPRRLELPRSEISDSIVERVAPRLSNITFLDVSYCGKIGAHALEAFGRNCKFLVGLQRRMHPIEVADKVCQDDEAYAIANTMPKLRRLEMAYLLLTTTGVLEILSRCRDLEYLDLRGCWDVKLDEKYIKECHPGLKVLGPHVTDCYERSFWEDCSDYSDSSIYSWDFMDDGINIYDGESDDDGVWNDEQALEGLEVRFYGGGLSDASAGFEWPPSP